MDVDQHYLVNLKRRPERLFSWLGSMWSQDFPMDRLTVVEAIDAAEFPTVEALAELAISEGFDYFDRVSDGVHYYHENISEDNQDFRARVLLAIVLSQLVTLKHIAEQGEHWSFMYEDDTVFRVPYLYVECLTPPPDADILTFHWGYSPDPKHVEIWKNRQYVPGDPNFFVGCIGKLFINCVAVTPVGAKKLLDIHVEKGISHETSFEELVLYHYRDLKGLYTCSHRAVDENYVHVDGEENFVSGVRSEYVDVSRNKQYWKTLKICSKGN